MAPNRNSGVPGVRLRYDVLERRLTEMGATTDVERGDILSVTRHTILRWRRGHHGVSLATAIRVADIIGVQLDHLIEADAAKPGTPPPSPPPPQPPRPPGPPPRAEAA